MWASTLPFGFEPPPPPPLRSINDRCIITDTGGLGKATNAEELKAVEFVVVVVVVALVIGLLLFFFLKIEFNGEELFDFLKLNY